MTKNLLHIFLNIILFWIIFCLIFNAYIATYMVLFVSGFISISNAIIMLNTVGAKLYNTMIFSIIGIACVVLLWIKIGIIMPVSIVIIASLLAVVILLMRRSANGR